MPFGIVIFSDLDNNLPDFAYMYTMAISHVGKIINVILYTLTNYNLKKGFINFMYLCAMSKKFSFKTKIRSELKHKSFLNENY